MKAILGRVGSLGALGLLLLGLTTASVFAGTRIAQSTLRASSVIAFTAEFSSAAALVADFSSLSQDRYSELEILFERGVYPPLSWMLGWYSGRCYWEHDRSTARNSLFVGWTETGGGDDGPLFPPGTEILKGLFGQNDRGVADYYDFLTPVLDAEINRYLTTERPNAIPAEAISWSVMTGHTGGARWYIRRYGSYLISQHEKDGKVFAYCYTFKRIK